MRRALMIVVLWAVAAPAAEPGRWAEVGAPNRWVKVADGPGPRTSFGLIYAPGEAAFICFGGSMMMDPRMDPKATSSPYSEMTLSFAKGVWENRFPAGKDGVWGNRVGPSQAPPFPGSYYAFKMQDAEGNTRPYLGAGYYNGMWSWGNYALEGERGRIVLYWTLPHQTAEYDVARRTWHLTASAADLPQQFREAMLFGAMCYDPVNKEVIGGQGEWVYSDGTWRKLTLGSPRINGLRAEAEALRLRARNLAGAIRARYYVAQSDQEASVNLQAAAAALASDAGRLADEVQGTAGSGRGYEQTQLQWAVEALAAARPELKKTQGLLQGEVTPEAIDAAGSARDAIGRVVLALAVCPPHRAHARMAYDAAHKKAVLFGGDALDRLLGDTWVYDPAGRRWEQRRPGLSPLPRAGHKLVYLPRSRKILLVDGYGYGEGRGETWIYDTQADSWQMLAEEDPARRRTPMRDYFPTPAAADGDDLVVTFVQEKSGLSTVAARIDATRVDADGTARLGVPPLTEKPYPAAVEDPEWFERHAPPPDPAAEAWSKSLPANTWVARQSPNWPEIDYGRSRCWGTAVLDADRDQILLFGGGHGTYDGNEVLHYSIRSNRHFIGHRPEHTLNFAPYGIGIPACKSYQGRPFVSCHAYHGYAYDPTLRRMVLCAQKADGKLFTYDPRSGDWECNLATPFHKQGFDVNQYMTKCVSTPGGVVAWTQTSEGLWRVDAARMSWQRLCPANHVGTPGWDRQGIAYDSRRDRLLLFSSPAEGEIVACDAKTGQTKVLGPAGKEHAAASAREPVYLPECDAVLLGARPAAGPDRKPRWLLYDCRQNRWLAVHLPGADPLGKETFNVSLGLMYDPKRELVWAMNSCAQPYVLKLELKTADLKPLDAAVADKQVGGSGKRER